MGFEYLDVETARERSGLRMVVVGGIPSPWSEAAKGMLHVKAIDWVAVRLDYKSEALKAWAGQRSGPVAIHDDERPRSGWADILLLAERLAPTPSLLPGETADRALMFGLSHEIMGEQGLCWSRRLQLVHSGLRDQGGFPQPVAAYLGRKYGYSAETGAAAAGRVAALLTMFARRLEEQRAAGHEFLVGDRLSAADIYLAAAMAMFVPLPRDVCMMDEAMRAALGQCDPATEASLDPVLLEHRDMMYARWLPLPLAL